MPAKFKTLEEILQANLCLGCGACAHIVPNKIEIGMSDEGYLRPKIVARLDQGEQAKAVQACPGAEIDLNLQSPVYHDLWGPMVASRVGWAKNDALRYRASSGGGLSALASYLLNEKKVDAVLHIGVASDSPFKNEYKISLTADQVANNAGSRYAPGAPITGLRDAITNYERIAFIGKPCDIVAIRKLANLDPEVKKRVKYCLSFMCAGVPSIKGTYAVVNQLGFSPDNIVNFQYRGNGWPGMATATTESGQSNSMTYDDSWGKILNRHLQFRCKICIDGTGESADVTCADAWYGSDAGYPSFDEEEGRSLVLSRTETGEALVQAASAAGYLHIEALPVSHIEKMQPYQSTRKRMTFSRVTALKLFGRKVPSYNYYFLWKLAKNSSIKSNLKSFFGMTKRIMKNTV